MTIPNTTHIYPARGKRILILVCAVLLGSAILAIGIGSDTPNQLARLAVLLMGGSCIAYPLLTILPQLLASTRPMLSLSGQGIQLRDGSLLNWHAVHSNQIIPVESDAGIVVGYRIEIRDLDGNVHAFGLPAIKPDTYSSLCLHYQRAARA
ncbi:hypothetical protein [Chitinilyticum piscinae]|uniref:PH domain-containing protein n=1 Tax=Chitinilyticum piscinae TaxID=2866724 RepID=A0A8J7FFW0_9NEIS|nr:hypothetical protein [Chitinilyticum piscinae]MBE9608628.1 hypothetical protein [Chitinilyticum piscinae]